MQLIKSVNVDSNQRRNILVPIKLDNVDTVYEEMKSSIRLLKGSIVERDVETNNDKDDEVNYSQNFNNRQSRSRSKQRYNDQQYQRRSSFNERRNSRDRGKSHENHHSKERSPFRRQRSQSRNYSQNRQSNHIRDYSCNRQRDGGQSYESVNLVFKETGDDAEIETEESFDKMIVDSGTTRTVAGRKWMENHLENISHDERKLVEKHSERRFFRFGDSARYPSNQEVTIPIRLGSLEEKLHVSVVDASIPLLLGKPDLKRFGFVINFEDEIAYITRSHELLPLETTLKGHLAVPIVSEDDLEEEVFLMNDDDKKEKERKVKKIHKVLAHPLPEILKYFFRNSSDNEKEIMEAVDTITDKCDVCRRFRKSPSRPKVGLPLSSDFNDCVAVDLKVKKGNKGYILYCIDTFSRLTRGVIINNKNPNTIVSGIIDCWVLGKGIGPGIPDRFMFDNGGEFNNPEVLDLAEKHGIKMHGVTAAHSPFSNGLVEKNHEVVDKMMSKLMADDVKMKEVDALNRALFAKNIEPNNKGFSSFQIVYGNNPTIPGIMNSTPPSLSTTFTSKVVRDHITKINKAREAFRHADNDERIKRALKSRIPSYTNERYVADDKVYFKQKDKVEWSGPASVIGQQGKVIFLRYGNNLWRVHMSRVIRVGEEFQQHEAEDEIKGDNKENNLINIPSRNEVDTENTSDAEITVRPKRRASFKRPEKSRRILYKDSNDDQWKKAHVKNVGPSSGSDQFKCTLQLENKDEMVIDFSEQNVVWEYEKFPCDKCAKTFDTVRSLRMHISIIHKDKNHKTVSFNEVEHVNYNEQTVDVKKVKIRFKEIMEERKLNERWKNMKTEETFYAEVKETPENTTKVNEAKEKELKNFDDYKAFEEVEYVGQDVLGTRFVLTEKPDKSIKARFVTKGFQENFPEQSDSPTSSRESIKVFLAIAANERWVVESSDVRCAFLQSEMIERDVFVEPPTQRRKPGMVWRLRKPCYGLNDASRKWFLSFRKTMQELGMVQSKRDSCLFYYHKDNKFHGELLVHVDDILSAGSDDFKIIVKKLREKYNFGRVEQGNFVYTGLNIQQDENMDIIVHQNSFVENLTTVEASNAGDPERVLDRDDNRLLRKAQGQLSWLATQTRPDISFDSFQMSTVLNRATPSDIKVCNKIIKKAKHQNVALKFSRLGNIEDLHIEMFADASLGNIEEGMHTKSAMGYYISLANNNLDSSPLHWKSCIIDKVAEDIKTAETLAFEKALDDAIHLSNLLTEIYTGKSTLNSIPILAKTDSKSLLESIYSTKKVKRKTMRVVISSIQQHLQNRILTDVKHVISKENLADVFTKQGVATDAIVNTLKYGSLLHRNMNLTDYEYDEN